GTSARERCPTPMFVILSLRAPPRLSAAAPPARNPSSARSILRRRSIPRARLIEPLALGAQSARGFFQRLPAREFLQQESFQLCDALTVAAQLVGIQTMVVGQTHAGGDFQ